MEKSILFLVLLGFSVMALAQKSNKELTFDRKYSFSTTYLSFANFGAEKTNTQHYELHVKYNLTSKDRIGIKMATWKLFADRKSVV